MAVGERRTNQSELRRWRRQTRGEGGGLGKGGRDEGWYTSGEEAMERFGDCGVGSRFTFIARASSVSAWPP